MAASTTQKRPRKRKAIPRPPRKTRVAVKAPPITDSEGMATFGNKLVAAALANDKLIVSPPYVATLQTAVGTLSSAIVAAEGGPDSAQTALLTATQKVHDIIVQHASWIQANANTMAPADAVNYITTAGFQVAKAPQRVTLTSPEISNGAPAVVHFEVPTIAGAIMWFTEVSTDGGKTYVRSTDTEHNKGDITGLPSGQTVYVRLRPYVRGSGYAQWTVLNIVVT